MANILAIPYRWLRPVYEQTSLHRSVISDVEKPALKQAYATCRAITRRHAKTFYMATRFLPNEKQRGIFAVYALCRFIDDLVDEAGDVTQKNKTDFKDISLQLDEWKEKLLNLYRGSQYDNPILIAYADVLRKYDIPEMLPLSLMEGVCSDLYKDRYQTFDELYSYSYKVASVVGLMTSEVFGYDEPKALDYAVDLGIAMQLTNILRDVGEDLQQNRIYLPQKDLRRFGISEQDLFDHRLNDSFKKMMQFQIERARQFYKKSKKGIALLNKDSRLPVYLAYYNYSGILRAIEANDYNVFTRRAYLGAVKKVSILPRIAYHLNLAAIKKRRINQY